MLSSIHQFNYALTTLAAHLSEWSGHHQLPGLEKFAQQIEDVMADLATSVRMAIAPQILPGLEETQNEIAAYLQELHAVRLEELVANYGNTPTRRQYLTTLLSAWRLSELFASLRLCIRQFPGCTARQTVQKTASLNTAILSLNFSFFGNRL
jgi:hypothetical protein